MFHLQDSFIMKIKKTILTAMIVGMTIGASASACEKVDIQQEVQDENCDDMPIVVDDHQNPTPEPCPLCGLG